MCIGVRAWGIAALIAATFGIAFAGGGEGEKWGKVTEEQWSLGAPDSLPEAAAVVIFDLGALEIPAPYPEAQIQLDRHVRLKVLNKAGADYAATASVTLREGDKFKGFKAHTLRRDGTKLELSEKDIFRKDLSQGEELLTFTFPGIEDGCILEYKYQITHRRFNLLDPWLFQGFLYKLKSQISITLHAGMDYNVVLSNVPEDQRKPQREDLEIGRYGAVLFRWTLKDLYPVEPEPYMAAAMSYWASLNCQLNAYRDPYNNLSFVEDWRTLGDEVLHSYNLFTEGKGKIDDVARALVAKETTVADTIRRLYQYVRDEILTSNDQKYFPYGDGSVAEVLERRVGNAREKNALLIEMLRSLLLEANPLLIATRDYAVFNPKIYQWTQFNHLICAVETRTGSYLLDCSDRGVPFPYLPPNDLSTGGLLLKPSASAAVSLSLPSRLSSMETYSKVRVHRDGSAVCSTHVSIRGYLISELRELVESELTAEMLRKSLYRGSGGDFTVDTYKQSGEIDGDSASVDVVVSFPVYCNHAERQLICPASPCWSASNPFEKPRRFFPIDFNYTMSYSDIVDLEYDDGLKATSTPSDTSMSIEGIGLARSVFGSDGGVRLISQLIISRSVFSPAAYGRIRDLYVKKSELAMQPVTLTY